MKIFVASLALLISTASMATNRICTITEAFNYTNDNIKVIAIHYSEPIIDAPSAVQAHVTKRPVAASMGRRIAFPINITLDEVLTYVQELQTNGVCNEIRNELTEKDFNLL